MTTYSYENWSLREPPFQDGDVVSDGNFSQDHPGTEICKSIKELTILGGNFTNCVAQPTWTINGGNWSQVDFEALEAAEIVEKNTSDAEMETICVQINSALKKSNLDFNVIVKDGQLIVVKKSEVTTL